MNIDAATPKPCPANATPFMNGRSLGGNHWRIIALVAGRRIAAPRPKEILSVTKIQNGGKRIARIPADDRAPAMAVAFFGPSFAEIIPPGIRNSVIASPTDATSKLTVPRPSE
jgi:hypothetical protein